MRLLSERRRESANRVGKLNGAAVTLPAAALEYRADVRAEIGCANRRNSDADAGEQEVSLSSE